MGSYNIYADHQDEIEGLLIGGQTVVGQRIGGITDINDLADYRNSFESSINNTTDMSGAGDYNRNSSDVGGIGGMSPDELAAALITEQSKHALQQFQKGLITYQQYVNQVVSAVYKQVQNQVMNNSLDVDTAAQMLEATWSQFGVETDIQPSQLMVENWAGDLVFNHQYGSMIDEKGLISNRVEVPEGLDQGGSTSLMDVVGSLIGTLGNIATGGGGSRSGGGGSSTATNTQDPQTPPGPSNPAADEWDRPYGGGWIYDSEAGVFRQIGGEEVFTPTEGQYQEGQVINDVQAGQVFGEWGSPDPVDPDVETGGTSGETGNQETGGIGDVPDVIPVPGGGTGGGTQGTGGTNTDGTNGGDTGQSGDGSGNVGEEPWVSEQGGPGGEDQEAGGVPGGGGGGTVTGPTPGPGTGDGGTGDTDGETDGDGGDRFGLGLGIALGLFSGGRQGRVRDIMNYDMFENKYNERGLLGLTRNRRRTRV